MAECIAPSYSYSYLTCNMNGNNNDKKSFPPSYPLILAKSHASIEKQQNDSVSQFPEKGVIVTSIANGLMYAEPVGSSSDKQILPCSMPEEGSSSKKPKANKRRKRNRVESQPSSIDLESQPQTKVSKPEGSGNVGEEGVINDASGEDTPKKKRRRRGKKEPQKKEQSFAVPTSFVKVQGAYFKVCPNCGSVATKLKAKKCQKCQIFFYNHWAKRCRIPPCPNCHFSRRSKPNETIPKNCEKCGHTLPLITEDKSDATSTPTSSSEVKEATNNEQPANSSVGQPSSSSTVSENNETLPLQQKLISEVTNSHSITTSSTTTTITPMSTTTTSSSVGSKSSIMNTNSTLTVSQRSAFTRVKHRRKQIFPEDIAVTRSGRVYKPGSTSPTSELQSTTVETGTVRKQIDSKSNESLKSPSERYFMDKFGKELRVDTECRQSKKEIKSVFDTNEHISNVTETGEVNTCSTQLPVCAVTTTAEENSPVSDQNNSTMLQECDNTTPLTEQGNRVVSLITSVQSHSVNSDVHILSEECQLPVKDTSDACIDGMDTNDGSADQHFEADHSSSDTTQEECETVQQVDTVSEFTKLVKSETFTNSTTVISDCVEPPMSTHHTVLYETEDMEVTPSQNQSVETDSERFKSESTGRLLDTQSTFNVDTRGESSPCSPCATQPGSDTTNENTTNPLLIESNTEEQQQTPHSRSSSIISECSSDKPTTPDTSIHLDLTQKQNIAEPNKNEHQNTSKRQSDSSKKSSLLQQPTVQHLIDQLQTKVQQQQKELETRLRQRIGHAQLILKDNKSVISPTETKNHASSSLPVNQKVDTTPSLPSTPVAPLSVIASQLKLPTDLIQNPLTLKTLLVPPVSSVSTTDNAKPLISSTTVSRPSVITSTFTKPNVTTLTDPLKNTIDRPQAANSPGPATSVQSPIIFSPHLTASLLSLLPPPTSVSLPALQQSNAPIVSDSFLNQLHPSPLNSVPISTTSTYTCTTASMSVSTTSEMNPKISNSISSTLSSLLSREQPALIPSVAPITRHVGTSTSPPQLVKVRDVAIEKKLMKTNVQPVGEEKTSTTTSSSSHSLKRLKPSKSQDHNTTLEETTKLAGSASTCSRNEDDVVEQDVPSRQSIDSTSPARFEKLEITSAKPKIRVSLLKPPDSSPVSTCGNITITCSSSEVNTSSLGTTTPPICTGSQVSTGISPPLSTVSSFGTKFQNFAVSPNLSVIATVETQRNTLTNSQRPIAHIMPKLAPSTQSPPILKPTIPSLLGTATKTNATSEQQIIPTTSPLTKSTQVASDCSIVTTHHSKVIPTPPPLRSIVTGGIHATIASSSHSQVSNTLGFVSQATHNSTIVEFASNLQQRISKALSQTDSITSTKPPTALSSSTTSLSEASPQCKNSQSAPMFSNAGVQTTSGGSVTGNKGLGGSLSGMKLPISGTFGSFGTSLSSKTLTNDSQNTTRNTGNEIVSKDCGAPKMKHIVPNIGRVFKNPGGGMVTITVCKTSAATSIPPASSVGVVNTGPVKSGGVFVTALKGTQNNAAIVNKPTHNLQSHPQKNTKLSLQDESIQASPSPPAGTNTRGTMTRQVIVSTLPPNHELAYKNASNTQLTSSPDKKCSVASSSGETSQVQCEQQHRDGKSTQTYCSKNNKESVSMELGVDEDYSKLMSSETLDSSSSISCSPSDVLTTVEKGANGGGENNGKSNHSSNGEDGEGGDSGEDGDSGREEDEDDSSEKRKGAGDEEHGFKRRKKKGHQSGISLGDELKTGEWSGSKGSDVLTTPAGGERRSRRKPKIEPLVIHEMEEEEMDRLESPSTSSAHINSPCFSVYELRHKMFSEFASNAVYAYTYKNQIKSLKPPIHWVYVLKRMGGMQETCHTCRLLDINHVKGMSQHYGNMSSLPSTLDELCRNELPKGRKVIDLSDIDPDDIFESNYLEKIPLCSFMEKPSQKKKFAKRKRKADEVSSSKKQRFDELTDEQSQDTDVTINNDVPLAMEYSSHDEFNKPSDHCNKTDHSSTSMSTNNAIERVQLTVKRSPPPLIKHESPSSKPVKKKYCPQCGNPIARKCKKCPSCGKRFGVYTFGRKLCPSCGRVNLARMTACYECGFSMQNAVKAIPKTEDESGECLKSKLSKYLHRYHRKHRLHSLPEIPCETDYGSHFGNSEMDHFLLPSSAQSSRHPSTGDMEDLLELGEMIPVNLIKEGEEPLSAGLGSSGEGGGPPLPKTKSKHAGYQYGRIPWGDADITCLVDENGLCKFCLQELCSKVLHTHAKSDVFDIVKSLKLPVQQGDNTLLKKLQALGLHSNRSPICRLIAAEELWTLLDALQEPVPEEVHQHLENISASTTPLMSPSHVSGLQSPGLVASGTSTGAQTATMVDEDEHGFESTLHELQCSDGQYVSILRTWNGEQYACLTEIWRKYFPEVNRNHLTSALKRLALETHMPTGQQATLLRSAGVISLRGAAGRLMKIDSMQTLLDDFSIPLQIGISGNEESDKPKEKPPILKPHPPTTPTQTSKQRRPSNYGLPSNQTVTNVRLPQDRILASKEDMLHATCMHNILQAVNHDDLRKLLENARDEAETSSANIDEEVQASATEFDNIQQLMHSRRELCHILSNEIGYLTVTNHSFMTELVRVNRTGKQTIQDVEHLVHTFDIALK